LPGFPNFNAPTSRRLPTLFFPHPDFDLIRKNPFGFELVNVIVNDSVRREAVTRKQEREFLRFIKEDAHFCKYYDAIFILFNTGLRISEFCGLTKSDLDFKNKRIRLHWITA
jgi:integrase